MSQELSPAQAELKLALWQADANSMTSAELYAWLVDSGLSHDVTTRLHEIIQMTKRVGTKVIEVGKIVLIKIIEFVKAHPFLVMGAGIGAAVGAAVTSLIISIPILGQILAPVATALGIVITVVGAVIGHNFDKKFKGVGQDIFEIAKSFFDLLADVINTVFRHVVIA